MLKLEITYPSRDEEIEILTRMARTDPEPAYPPAATLDDVAQARDLVNQIYVDEKVKHYIVDIVLATRDPHAYGMDIGHYIDFGASPRASIYLT